MTVQYPVHFTEVDNCILIEVPDLEILTQGRNMKDAIYMAKDAIKLMCEVKRDHHQRRRAGSPDFYKSWEECPILRRRKEIYVCNRQLPQKFRF